MFVKFLILFTIFTFNFGDRDSDFIDECMKNAHMKQEQDLEYFKGNFLTDKFSCYVKCIYTKKGILDDEGNINVEKFDGVSGDFKLEKLELAEFIECIEKIGQIKKCRDINKIENCYRPVDK